MTGLVGRDSDDFIQWHRPKSVSDALEQASMNCMCGCLICCSGIGVCIRDGIVQNIRKCCGLRKPHLLEDRRAEVRKQNTVTPLPDTRKRSITLPLPEMTTSHSKKPEQRTDEQVSTNFFTKLPLDVRNLIWEYVISRVGQGSVLHVFRRDQKMYHWRCRKQVNGQSCSWNNPCSKALPFNTLGMTETGQYVGDPRMMTLQQFDNSRVERVEPEQLLSLLLTCRKIYSETVALLYSTPHFHFPESTNFVSFRDSILLQRLNSIRILSLDWSESGFARGHSHGQWEAIFNIIYQMRDLQELRIFAKMIFVDLESPRIRMMQPLMSRVKELKVYEHVVPNDQLRLWDGFINGDMEATLVELPKRKLINVFENRNEDIIV